MYSGIGTMGQTRQFLLAKGMSSNFADLLAAKYIKEKESHKVVSVMDLFEKESLIDLVDKTSLSDICLNYQTLNKYTNGLYREERF